MKAYKHILVAIPLVLVLVVALQNTETVETRLLFATISMPRALLLFFTLLIGVLIGLIFGAKLTGSIKTGLSKGDE